MYICIFGIWSNMYNPSLITFIQKLIKKLNLDLPQRSKVSNYFVTHIDCCHSRHGACAYLSGNGKRQNGDLWTKHINIKVMQFIPHAPLLDINYFPIRSWLTM